MAATSQRLGLPALTALVVGSMVGAGIFTLPAAFARLSDGQKKGFIKMSTKDYDATIELIKFVDSLRKA